MDKKEKQKTSCIHRNPLNAIKYGFQNNKQKYKCRECGKFFLENKKESYSRTQKKYLSMLYYFLKAQEDKEITIEEAIKNLDDNFPEISKFRLIQKVQSDSKKINCYNPRLLICEDDKNITIYRFAPRKLDENENSQTYSIVDSDDQKNIIYRSYYE